MSFWTAKNLRAVTGGVWVRRPAAELDPERGALASGLSTDTRAVRPGEAFLALRGERFDAHEFLHQAVHAGASLLIVQDVDAAPESVRRGGTGPAVLRVADTRRALGQLAAAYRRSLEGTKVIAVVGSNGKTTTTKLIHSVLSAKLRGSCSPKSFNNDVGVPLTILAARPGDQYLVCEVGSNHPGETGRLSRIVEPDIAVVTSVGRDHMEFFGDTASVAREHASIFVDLRPGGAAIVPADEPLLADYLRPVPQVLTFGPGPGADLRLTRVEHVRGAEGGPPSLRFGVNERLTIDLPLIGEHNALNALAAIAVARRLGLDDAAIVRGLGAAQAADMRLNWRVVGGASLLVDCYNANPDSVLAAVRTFASVAPDAGRRVLILGDMLEMGEHAAALHEEVARRIAGECPARLVVTVGQEALRIAGVLQSQWPGCEFQMLSELSEPHARRIASLIRPGDCVLLKGSRGVRLEGIVAALERQAPGAGESGVSGGASASGSGPVAPGGAAGPRARAIA
ncbi:MAG: UDP-N-acetylmuramoyl-tripeptide--D-alanyl-D-alanine ligase [Planctomycetota bacterium]|nr:UDP-N-acetylmuramoyl-tripeptide--D-alanyl-D-alanine ligase [Planctomycetota bacterium]